MGFDKKYSFFMYLVVIFWTFSITAEEADEYYPKDQPAPKMANAKIDQHVNDMFKEFVRGHNEKAPSCERTALVRELMYFFDSNFSAYGNRLRAMARSVDQPDNKNDIEFYSLRSSSIYADTGVWSDPVRSLNISGTAVGLDKVDHFFGNGGLLWEEWERREKKTVGDLLVMNVNQEQGQWGLSGTGVKSYGDLSANWSGFQFYRNLLDGESPHLKCEDGKVTLNREFAIEKYFSKSWSEAINCSAFSSSDISTKFARNLKNLGLKCPMDEGDCKEVVESFKDQPEVRKAIVSPTCLSGRTVETSVEERGEVTWTDISKGLRGINVELVFDFIKGAMK